MTRKQICRAAFWALLIGISVLIGVLLGAGAAHFVVLTLTLK